MNLFGQSNQKLFPEVEKQSFDVTQERIEKLKELFPNIVSDGKIDWKTLKLMLGEYITEEDERYRFTWNGKTKAIQEVGIPTTSTLRPDKDSSEDWETTENLYIEGDNLEVLKVLQNSYNGKIKVIYIDPPYNTDGDFIYKDDFALSLEETEKIEGLRDKKGILKTADRLTKNSKDSAKYHTNWLNMMYPRLSIARDLLKSDGVIFISIDDNEVHNLKKICDEIFGENNFIDILKWKKKKQPSFLATHIAKVMEYVLIYSKNSSELEKISIEGTTDLTKKVVNISNKESIRKFKPGVRVKIADKGIIKKGKYKIKTTEIEYLSDIQYKNGVTQNEVEVKAKFSVSQEKIDDFIDNSLLFITGQYGLRRDVSEEELGKRKSITDLLLNEWGDNQESDEEFKKLFKKKYFDYTKPTLLIKNLVKSIFSENEIILDFFSGASTTADAVMQLNLEDGGNRKFIMVQIPEITYEGKKDKDGNYIINEKTGLPDIQKDSEARKDGFNYITEIGKTRIRKAGEKLKEKIEKENSQLKIGEEPKKLPDVGFKTFKIDSSNFNEWDTSYEAMEKAIKESSEGKFTTYKQDRTDLDLVYEIMLKEGLFLTENIEEIEMNAGTLYKIADGIIYIFLKKLDEEVVKK
ncbi:site-specific DNA-methyltransferase [Fusobacterium ulcerans]